jgi:hypothetical protein
VAAIPLLDDAAGQDDVAAAVIKLNTLITAYNEFQGGTTDQIYKKTNATDFNFEACNSILPASGTANLKIKVVEIGDWNMDSTATLAVAHGVSDFTKVRSMSAIIRKDDDATYYNLNHLTIAGTTDGSGQITSIDATNINLEVNASGFFDSTDFNATSYNRGFITIIYEG